MVIAHGFVMMAIAAQVLRANYWNAMAHRAIFVW
tara:strand:- start:571 stop:672 length:102 start_codon:yes stop_codon:yes gene_type:complete